MDASAGQQPETQTQNEGGEDSPEASEADGVEPAGERNASSEAGQHRQGEGGGRRRRRRGRRGRRREGEPMTDGAGSDAASADGVAHSTETGVDTGPAYDAPIRAGSGGPDIKPEVIPNAPSSPQWSLSEQTPATATASAAPPSPPEERAAAPETPRVTEAEEAAAREARKGWWRSRFKM
jgi:ribonuclease E